MLWLPAGLKVEGPEQQALTGDPPATLEMLQEIVASYDPSWRTADVVRGAGTDGHDAAASLAKVQAFRIADRDGEAHLECLVPMSGDLLWAVEHGWDAPSIRAMRLPDVPGGQAWYPINVALVNAGHVEVTAGTTSAWQELLRTTKGAEIKMGQPGPGWRTIMAETKKTASVEPEEAQPEKVEKPEPEKAAPGAPEEAERTAKPKAEKTDPAEKIETMETLLRVASQVEKMHAELIEERKKLEVISRAAQSEQLKIRVERLAQDGPNRRLRWAQVDGIVRAAQSLTGEEREAFLTGVESWPVIGQGLGVELAPEDSEALRTAGIRDEDLREMFGEQPSGEELKRVAKVLAGRKDGESFFDAMQRLGVQ